jgi:hypothetical protein
MFIAEAKENLKLTPEGCNAGARRGSWGEEPTTLRPSGAEGILAHDGYKHCAPTGLGGAWEYDGNDPAYLFDFDGGAEANPGGAQCL